MKRIKAQAEEPSGKLVDKLEEKRQNQDERMKKMEEALEIDDHPDNDLNGDRLGDLDDDLMAMVYR